MTARPSVDALLDVAGFRTIDAASATTAAQLYGAPISDDLRALFARAEGEYLGGHSFMRVFELDELEDVLGIAHLYAGGLAGYRYFASDDGDFFYAIAPAGDVVKVERGAAHIDMVKHCAPDLATFIRRTLEGEKWFGATTTTGDARQALAAVLVRIARAPAGVAAIYDAGDRCGVALDSTLLEDLCAHADGFAAGDVTIRSCAQLATAPALVVGDIAVSPAIWFADRGDERFAYAIDSIGSVAQGDVIAVRGEDVRRLGPLADVIAGWLARATRKPKSDTKRKTPPKAKRKAKPRAAKPRSKGKPEAKPTAKARPKRRRRR